MPIDTVLEVLAHLQAGTPDPPDAPPTATALEPWRARIDVLDRAIIHLLNERVRCAHEIGALKKEMGMPVYVPSREVLVIKNVCAHNKGPLPDDAVKRLYERVIDETRSLERHHMRQIGQLPPSES